ncbi:MAG TPA: hypothetical protein DCL15_00495 [Chloroflexi bacterium]|nr:hypothetical protein [Chloroflexota bacterium]HHW86020.1 hypothetical protein [Chloroflexota bacterium]
MLERSSLPTYVSTELTDSLYQTFNRRWFKVLQEMLWLPETYQQYLLLLAGTLVVGMGMLVHVWLNVQIAEARVLVRQLTAESQQIERENSEVIFAIANSSTLARVEEAARQQGFRPVTERVYVRRDAVRSAGLTSAAPERSPALPQSSVQSSVQSSAQTPGDDHAGANLLDAAGRGLGAAGEWLQQFAVTTAQAVGGFTSGFMERWMP